MKRNYRRRLLSVLLLLLLTPMLIPAQREDSLLGLNKLKYTNERPLIYEGAEDLWPYSFLNEKGEPDGYNIELIRLIMKQLNIPYEIKMKPRLMAFKDLREGRSDLMIGLTAGFHEEFAHYSDNSVTLFTQSVLSPRSNPTEIRNFRDLATHKVIVNDSSLCHHLMIDYGWGDNAIPTRTIGETIKQMSSSNEGELVWNTLSLKWMLHKFQITNMEITPVNMPHGEYKFMSSDLHLIHLMDSVFSKLNATDQLVPLQNRWFYPERLRKEEETPQWVINTAIGVGIVLLILLLYTILYQQQARRITRENASHTQRLSLILETCEVRIWTYDVPTNTFAWHNEHGQVAYTYTTKEFAHRYPPADFAKLQDAIKRLSSSMPGTDGYEEAVTLNLKARDSEDGDQELHDFSVRISVLLRDASGKPTTLIGTKMDITNKEHQKRIIDEHTTRYWAIFNTPLVGVLYFDKDGVLVNINNKACEMFCCDHDAILEAKVQLRHVLDTGSLRMEDMDGYHASQLVDIDSIPPEQRRIPLIKRRGILCNEFHLATVYDDDRNILGIFALCCDISHVRTGQKEQREATAVVDDLRRKLAEYDRIIDSVLHESDVRLVTYSTESHMLRIFRSANEVQHTLSQTRCMSLADKRSEKLVMRTLDIMDHCADRDIVANVLTNLRIKGGLRLAVQFSLTPSKDDKGNIKAYVGLCRDFSEMYHIQNETAKESARVQEVENAKNSFVNNMAQEIHQPMNAVVNFVARLQPNVPSADEEVLKNGILENAEKLVTLIDKVLFLSRLEAHMIEIMPQPCDYAALFSSQCMEGWERHRKSGVRYIVENPYEKLVINVDSTILGQLVRQLTSNAAAHTYTGTVRARCEYMGRRLIIAIDDTGEGIPPQDLARIQQQKARSTTAAKGLGLSICQEIVRQLNGTIEISSEKSSGTTVYITIPCNAESIRRRRN